MVVCMTQVHLKKERTLNDFVELINKNKHYTSAQEAGSKLEYSSKALSDRFTRAKFVI
jgi:hypothetical protein